jgi:predicted ArsR family transcriptional regulator
MPTMPKDPGYAARPANAAILKLLSRTQGATAAEIGKARDLQPHTVRSCISRLVSRAGIKLQKRKDERRGTVYRTARLNGSARTD